jgi:hypothetical protein
MLIFLEKGMAVSGTGCNKVIHVLTVLFLVDVQGPFVIDLASAFNLIAPSIVCCYICFIYTLLFICNLNFSGSGRRCCDN